MKVTPTIMAGQTSAGQSPPWPYLGKRVVLVRFVTPKLPATSVRVDQARLKGPLRRGCLGESGEVTCGSFCCDGRSRLRIHWGGDPDSGEGVMEEGAGGESRATGVAAGNVDVVFTSQ